MIAIIVHAQNSLHIARHDMETLFCTAGHFWGESAGDGWNPFTKEQ